MADEIKQVLGFEATQALDALNQLDSGFAKLQQNLNAAPTSFAAFNAGAGKTVSALIQIRDRANEAATALNKLNTIKPPPSVPGGGLPGLPGGGGSAQSGLLSGQAAANAMNALLGITTTNANTAGVALNNLGNTANNAMTRGRRSTDGFALSLETVSRVIGTQLIVRGLNSIRTAVEDSFQGFIDFNRAVAEIQTISQNESFTQIGASIRKLSDDFNAPILDVAKAKYDALSNGFVSVADSTAIVTAALKFAKVGISDTAQAVDLISTSLNAYGKSAQEAETISAKMFKTIELGRVVGSELANSFGRVAPIAKEIGASEDEILAAFSSITIGGVKASEAATQIRATLTALLKPSEAAQVAFRKLGVESGEQLIQSRGLQGALQALISTTDGSASATAKLFPNVRALNGVLRETGTGADIFQNHLEKIKASSAGLLNQTFKVRVESDAEKVSADLNKIKNFFTVDLGSQLIGIASSFSNAIGGAKNLIVVMSAFTPVVFAATASLVAYGTIVGVATGLNRLFTTSVTQAGFATRLLGGALGAVTVAVAAFAAGQAIGGAIVEGIEADRKRIENEANQFLQFKRDQAAAQGAIDQAAADANGQLIQRVIADLRKSYFEQVDIAQEANKKLIDEDKATFDKIIAGRDKFAADLKRASQQANTDAIDSRKRSNDIQAQLDDQRFNFGLKRVNDLSKAFKERQRAEQLANQGALQLAGAKTPEQKDAAQSSLQRAEAFARQAIASAETSGNLTAQVQAERTLEGILQKRIGAEQAFAKARADDAKKLADEAAKEEARVTRLKALAKDFLDKSNLFNKQGDLLPADERAKNIADAKADLAKFKEEAFGKGSKFQLTDLFSFDQLEQRLSQSFTQGEVKQLSASGEALASLNQQIEKSLGKKPFEIAVALNLDTSGLEGLSSREQLDALSGRGNEKVANFKELDNANQKRLDAEQTINKELERGNLSYKEQAGLAEKIAVSLARNITSLNPKLADVQRAAIQKIRDDINKELNSGTANENTVNSLEGRLINARKGAVNAAGPDINRAQLELDILTKSVEKKKELRQLDSQGQTPDARNDAQSLLNAAGREAAIRAAETEAEERKKAAAREAATSGNTFKSASADAVSSSDKIATNMLKAAQAAERAALASANIGSSETATAALGGRMSHFASGGRAIPNYFSNGGAAKGTDNIPTMLSQDETVVNARSSRKFFPQLQSIQAGFAPSNNTSRAGDTITIGDININGSSNPKETAREVLNLIRREQRRGTGNSLN